MTWPNAPGREPKMPLGAVDDSPCRMIRAVPGPRRGAPWSATAETALSRNRGPNRRSIDNRTPAVARRGDEIDPCLVRASLPAPAKKPPLAAEATGVPCRLAPRQILKNFRRAAKGFLAMNEQTQSLSANLRGGARLIRLSLAPIIDDEAPSVSSRTCESGQLCPTAAFVTLP